MKEKVIIIGPAHPLRGGLASFDERLANQFQQQHFDIIQLEHLYLCLYLVDIRKYSKAKVVLR